jgi:hypothetical protein
LFLLPKTKGGSTPLRSGRHDIPWGNFGYTNPGIALAGSARADCGNRHPQVVLVLCEPFTLLFNAHKQQIPRSARDDTFGEEFFSNPLR